jgi:hypothetical protein
MGRLWAAAEALRKGYGLGKIEARGLSMVPFCALAGGLSYAAMRKDTRGTKLWIAALRAVLNGIARCVTAPWILKLAEARQDKRQAKLAEVGV